MVSHKPFVNSSCVSSLETHYEFCLSGYISRKATIVLHCIIIYHLLISVQYNLSHLIRIIVSGHILSAIFSLEISYLAVECFLQPNIVKRHLALTRRLGWEQCCSQARSEEIGFVDANTNSRNTTACHSLHF